jgi:DNA-directed RNA polymerase specialized sigma24 family protein
MSPLSLRRYRAERLLREEFEGLRGRVLASVRGRLLSGGVSLDQGDLEACYAQAWQGLYAATLDGQEVANAAGWLVVVTFRRAIEEQRGRRLDRGPDRARDGAERQDGREPHAASQERDLAAQLDDRARLRELLEGFRGRLNVREREAAALCYLQGLSRAEAAARMGLSEARMRKLMDGRAPGRPGVAIKVGALVETIRGGRWCEEQGSLMRALAYGILDPDGERYRLAMVHRRECPACRAYVVSLRGLAAVLPPPLFPLGLAAGTLLQAGAGAHGGVVAAAQGAAAGAGSSAGVGATGAAGVGASGAAAGAAGAAGAGGAAGAAGGGWLFVGAPLGAKLAVGCLLALGIGAGCIELSAGGHRAGAASPPAHSPRRAGPGASGGALISPATGGPGARSLAGARAAAGRVSASVRNAPGAGEFSPERRTAAPVSGTAPAAAAAAASSGSTTAPTASQPAGTAAAAREFSPG